MAGKRATRTPGDTVLRASAVGVRHGRRPVLREVDLELRQGELVGLIGRNGSGKTTLLRALLGHHPLASGEVSIAGLTGTTPNATAIGGKVGYLPQQATAMFFAESVREELAYTAQQRNVSLDIASALREVGLEDMEHRHPRDLSGGERERLALAIMLVGDPAALLLDEPTRGMDAWRKADLARILEAYRRRGGAVLMATHDVDLVAEAADRVVMLGDAQVIADGAPEEVLGGSLTFTTQTQLVFGDAFLTPEQAIAAMTSSS